MFVLFALELYSLGITWYNSFLLIFSLLALFPASFQKIVGIGSVSLFLFTYKVSRSKCKVEWNTYLTMS